MDKQQAHFYIFEREDGSSVVTADFDLDAAVRGIEDCIKQGTVLPGPFSTVRQATDEEEETFKSAPYRPRSK